MRTQKTGILCLCFLPTVLVALLVIHTLSGYEPPVYALPKELIGEEPGTLSPGIYKDGTYEGMADCYDVEADEEYGNE